MAAESLSASMEDYLEAIYEIVLVKGVARVRDIVARLKVHKSTVTAALHVLSDRKLVNYEPYEAVTLTRKGQRVGSEILARHQALAQFFVSVLGVENDVASEAACKIEHVIPPEVLQRLTKFAEFTRTCPRAGARWIQGFGYFCESGPDHGDCEQCLSVSLEDARNFEAEKKRRRREGT